MRHHLLLFQILSLEVQGRASRGLHFFPEPIMNLRTHNGPGNPSRTLVPRSWYQDLGTKILVSKPWYQDLGTKILVPRSWYQDLRTKILVPRSWYQDLSTKILVSRSWYQDLDTKIWYQDPGTARHGTAQKHLARHGSTGHGPDIFGTARIHQIWARHGTGRPC